MSKLKCRLSASSSSSSSSSSASNSRRRVCVRRYRSPPPSAPLAPPGPRKACSPARARAPHGTHAPLTTSVRRARRGACRASGRRAGREPRRRGRSARFSGCATGGEAAAAVPARVLPVLLLVVHAEVLCAVAAVVPGPVPTLGGIRRAVAQRDTAALAPRHACERAGVCTRAGSDAATLNSALDQLQQDFWTLRTDCEGA